jgi:hypothetical protein
MDKDWEAYAKSVEANTAEIKEYLAPLEAGEMKLSELRRGCDVAGCHPGNNRAGKKGTCDL